MTSSTADRSPLLELDQASFGYGERTIIDRITLSMAAGEVIALLGPNGCGKSTLMRGLLGLVEHQGGHAALFGTPLAQFSDRHRIGYVPQRHTLSSSVRANVREIVDVGRIVHRPWWRPPTRADRIAVTEALDNVGLLDRAGEEVGALSGGQQRRVLIARALAGGPDVLFMDEPTAGVDAGNQGVLAEVLGRQAAAGTSMLIVTHELAALRPLVTRVICLQQGHIDFDGSAAAYDEHRELHLDDGAHHHHDASPGDRRHDDVGGLDQLGRGLRG